MQLDYKEQWYSIIYRYIKVYEITVFFCHTCKNILTKNRLANLTEINNSYFSKN